MKMILSLRPLLLLPALLLVTARGDLVGHWKFDEGSGTTYADSSPNENDAMAVGSNLWSTDTAPTGIPNPAAIQFDGQAAYVSSPYPGIEGNAPRTVAFWIKTTTNGAHGIVAWGNSTVNGAKWHIRINDNANNGPAGAIRTESQGDFTIGSTLVNDGAWHHIASVYPEGGGELGTVLHYVDGVLDNPGGNNASTQPVITSTTADPVTIGRRTQGATDTYFPGLVDDVRIYDRALSAQEVSDLMGATPTEDGLVLYMPLDEGDGDVIDDLGSGDNDGVLNGGASSIPTWSTDAPPHLSSSLAFNNSGDHLLTEFPGIGGTASRSITFWFKTTFTADNGIVAWGNAGGNGLKWHARINSTGADGPVGALRLEIQGGRTVATTPVTDDQWHHAAIVFEEDGDPDLQDLVFYLDGELDPVSLVTSVPIDTQIGGGGGLPVWIGARDQVGALRGFAGNLADVRIYDSGLTQEEVQAIMMGADGRKLKLEVAREDGSLRFSWESREGMRYRLRSTADPAGAPPAEWLVFDGRDNLEANPPLNTLTLPLPAEAARFFVVEEFPPPPVVIYSETFDTGAAGWTSFLDGEPGTEWELGPPSLVGPPAAHSEPNCFATNLASNYAFDAFARLRSRSIDLTTAPGATLYFWHYVDIEPTFDWGEIAVLDATNGTELGLLGGRIDGLPAGWEQVRRTFPPAALGREVILEFRFESDNFENRAGWYIDDVEVTVP